MRKLIAAFKTSVDGKIEGPEGFADWVDAWSDDYGLSSQFDNKHYVQLRYDAAGTKS